MKHHFNRVVVLLNDLDKMEALLKKGFSFATQHHTLLEVLFVHEVPLFEVPDFFLSDEKISKSTLNKAKIKEEIEKILKQLDPKKQHALFVYENDTVERVLNLVKESKETLIITQYHETLSSELIEETPYAYWIIKEEKVYKNIALPIDLHDGFKPYMALTQHIFPNIPIKLLHDYQYTLSTLISSENYLNATPMSLEVDFELNQQAKEAQKKVFNDYLDDYGITGMFLEGEGVLQESLVAYIQEHHFDLTVLYKDSEELFLNPTLTMELMKNLSTDFFVCQH